MKTTKKIYVITGATSGIGNALLKELAKDNKVFAGYRNEKYYLELKSVSENVVPFYIDMTKKDSISQAVAFIKSETSNIDTMFNIAGCVIAGAVENIPVDKIRKQFEVNTFSHLDFSQKLLDLISDGGKIINVSSMASFGIFPFVSPYCASKRALDILFNSMMLEFNRDIKIVSVKPGVIATPLWEKSIDLNKDEINNCKNYKKEMEYLVNNAKDNGKTGLKVEKVVDLIKKIDNMENPKASYTVGYDAKVAELISKLPQNWLNFLIKFMMDKKINK